MFEFLFEEFDVIDSIILLLFMSCLLYTIYRIFKDKPVIYHVNYNVNYVSVDDNTNHDNIIRIPIEDRVDLAIDDQHNVHNKTVRKHTVDAINLLKKSDLHKYSIESAINNISELIELNSNYDSNTLFNAKRAIEMINQLNSFYHNAHIGEKEIVRLVWERINHSTNSKIVDVLKNNLIEQLADCVNDNGVHCIEGRITRILQTLEKSDAEDLFTFRPLWAYKEEISDVISRYRDKLFDKLPKKYRDIDNKLQLNADDYKDLDKFNKCLIKNLERKFDMDYVSSGILNMDELKDLTKNYYESLYEF